MSTRKTIQAHAIWILALGLLLVPAESKATQKCFDVSIEQPFWTISSSTKVLSRSKTHTGNSADKDTSSTSTWQSTSSHIGMDLDHDLLLDNALEIFASGVDWYDTAGTCVNVTATALHGDVSFGRVLWGACEPSASFDVSFNFKSVYMHGDWVPELRVWPIAAGTLTCGLYPLAWVSGTVGATAEFGIKAHSSLDRLERYMFLSVYAEAEAGVLWSTVWDWDETLFSGSVISDVVYY